MVNNDKVAAELNYLASSANRIALAITPDACPGHDPYGGVITSLTEAVMGITNGLHEVADALGEIARSIEEAK